METAGQPSAPKRDRRWALTGFIERGNPIPAPVRRKLQARVAACWGRVEPHGSPLFEEIVLHALVLAGGSLSAADLAWYVYRYVATYPECCLALLDERRQLGRLMDAGLISARVEGRRVRASHGGIAPVGDYILESAGRARHTGLTRRGVYRRYQLEGLDGLELLLDLQAA